MVSKNKIVISIGCIALGYVSYKLIKKQIHKKKEKEKIKTK